MVTSIDLGLRRRSLRETVGAGGAMEHQLEDHDHQKVIVSASGRFKISLESSNPAQDPVYLYAAGESIILEVPGPGWTVRVWNREPDLAQDIYITAVATEFPAHG